MNIQCECTFVSSMFSCTTKSSLVYQEVWANMFAFITYVIGLDEELQNVQEFDMCQSWIEIE